jgi:hypothetical protein
VWPEHVDALHLFLACMGQLQQQLGGMGGARWRAAQAVNVAQELSWMGIGGKRQTPVIGQYRQIELEALRLLNDREIEAAKKS